LGRIPTLLSFGLFLLYFYKEKNEPAPSGRKGNTINRSETEKRL
jgi:hypothetical protein